MTDLSSAAQAIWDAWESEWSKGSLCHDQRSIAAALRAAADQVVPDHANPVGDAHDDARHDQWMRIRYKLLAIATELEAQ
jgi:hypothetical protein